MARPKPRHYDIADLSIGELQYVYGRPRRQNGTGKRTTRIKGLHGLKIPREIYTTPNPSGYAGETGTRVVYVPGYGDYYFELDGGTNRVVSLVKRGKSPSPYYKMFWVNDGTGTGPWGAGVDPTPEKLRKLIKAGRISTETTGIPLIESGPYGQKYVRRIKTHTKKKTK